MLAFASSIFSYNRIKYYPLKWFPPFLGSIILVEFTGKYLGQKFGSNAILYNFLSPFEFAFYAVLYSRYFENKKYKKIAALMIPALVVFFLINSVFFQGVFEFQNYTFVVLSFLIIILVFLYLFESFERNENVNLFSEPMFWISSGLLLFHLGDFVDNLLMNYFLAHEKSEATRIFELVNNNLIIVLYSCFAIAFLICRKPKQILV